MIKQTELNLPQQVQFVSELIIKKTHLTIFLYPLDFLLIKEVRYFVIKIIE